MSLRRKVYRMLIAAWEALVTCWYMLAIASCVALMLFLAAFIVGAAFEIAERVTGP